MSNKKRNDIKKALLNIKGICSNFDNFCLDPFNVREAISLIAMFAGEIEVEVDFLDLNEWQPIATAPKDAPPIDHTRRIVHQRPHNTTNPPTSRVGGSYEKTSTVCEFCSIGLEYKDGQNVIRYQSPYETKTLVIAFKYCPYCGSKND